MLYRFFLSKEFNSENKYKLEDIKNVFLLQDDLEGELIRKIGMHKFDNVMARWGCTFVSSRL